MSVNPEDFGEVKANGKTNKERIDKFDIRFDKIENKINILMYLILSNMATGLGALVYGSDIKSSIIAFVQFIHLS